MQIYKTSKARENIFSKIRKGLSGEGLAMPYPDVEKNFDHIYTEKDISNEEIFAEAFTALGGKFVFCDNEQELMDNIIVLHEDRNWKKLLCSDERILKLFKNYKIDILQPADPTIEDAEACITGCETLVARTGSILFSSMQPFGRTSSVFYPVHIVFAYANQITKDVDDGLTALKKKYGNNMPSMISLTTGPSRTADIEKTLVVGVHGPCEIFCFFINAEE